MSGVKCDTPVTMVRSYLSCGINVSSSKPQAIAHVCKAFVSARNLRSENLRKLRDLGEFRYRLVDINRLHPKTLKNVRNLRDL